VLDSVSPYLIGPHKPKPMLDGLGIDPKVHMNQILILMKWEPKIVHLANVESPADINDAVNKHRSPPIDKFNIKSFGDFYRERKGILVLVSAPHIEENVWEERALRALCYKLKVNSLHTKNKSILGRA
jgi:hypothetical protein